ncbi:hypothetical protein Lal_00018621 [Lupinus albus]|nr:hypothetical protein Lal_00018621 [Lupinus albus]
MHTYAKLMKEFLIKKRQFPDNETVYLDASCIVIIQNFFLPMSKDPDSFTCLIENLPIGKIFLDLGASRIDSKHVSRPRPTFAINSLNQWTKIEHSKT